MQPREKSCEMRASAGKMVMGSPMSNFNKNNREGHRTRVRADQTSIFIPLSYTSQDTPRKYIYKLCIITGNRREATALLPAEQAAVRSTALENFEAHRTAEDPALPTGVFLPRYNGAILR